MKPATKPCENFKERAVGRERSSGPDSNEDELK